MGGATSVGSGGKVSSRAATAVVLSEGSFELKTAQPPTTAVNDAAAMRYLAAAPADCFEGLLVVIGYRNSRDVFSCTAHRMRTLSDLKCNHSINRRDHPHRRDYRHGHHPGTN